MKLRQVDPNAQPHDVVALRGYVNRMDPCYRFPRHDLADLFASATVTESRFVALDHMQVDFVTVRKTRLRKFRKNIISFPQNVSSFARRKGMLNGFRVGDRVNSVRGPGRDPERPPVRAADAAAEKQQQFANDKSGHLVFPATVVRVEGVEWVIVKYDYYGDEEFLSLIHI